MMLRGAGYFIFFLVVFSSCERNTQQEQPLADDPWLNHGDSARYIGMQTCRLCHQQIYQSFKRTGMGSSIGLATKEKSAADFHHPLVADDSSGFQYGAFWSHDSLYMREFRIEKKDTVHRRTERVNYIIGSGQHTN